MRRNFAPIIAIFFLTLPNSIAQQIGIYSGIGFLAGFLLEIPSGYLSDTIGHKKALILAKVSMIVSTLFFLTANSWIFFALGSAFMSIGFAFSSGTHESFLHNTLIGIKKEKNYTKINSKMHANISLISMFIILLIPILTEISILFPFKIYLGVDLIGLLLGFSLISPKLKIKAEDKEPIPLPKQLKQFWGTGFYTMAIFLGLIGGFILGMVGFNSPYVTSLGLPVIYVGMMMAGARLVWFVLGNYAHKIERKIKLKKLMIFEIIFFPTALILISLTKNPFVAIIFFALTTGYMFGRGGIFKSYFLNKFSINKRYKATMLSIKAQISSIIAVIVAFAIGFVMNISFKLGYLTLGIILFILMFFTYLNLKKYLK
ncbi:MFS transporter [archaeon]|nr:MFS transporter [archaeon]